MVRRGSVSNGDAPPPKADCARADVHLGYKRAYVGTAQVLIHFVGLQGLVWSFLTCLCEGSC